MKAVVCNSLSELFDAEPGAIFLEENGYLMCKCPRAAECDHSGVIQIPVHAPGESGKGWTITGYPEATTLSPSVFQCPPPHDRQGCSWHGWLQNGEWRKC
jgi:hypothetical protein